MVVFDSDVRHHSKRTTIQRQSKIERKNIDIIIQKSKLMNIVQTRRKLDSLEERNILLEEETQIEKILE
jgi:hypothetical protein